MKLVSNLAEPVLSSARQARLLETISNVDPASEAERAFRRFARSYELELGSENHLTLSSPSGRFEIYPVEVRGVWRTILELEFFRPRGEAFKPCGRTDLGFWAQLERPLMRDSRPTGNAGVLRARRSGDVEQFVERSPSSARALVDAQVRDALEEMLERCDAFYASSLQLYARFDRVIAEKSELDRVLELCDTIADWLDVPQVAARGPYR